MTVVNRSATAVWEGSGKEGKGTLATQSGVLDSTPYSFQKRFGEEKGTNPEELIAAAHAGCFTMALAFALQGEGLTAGRLETTAKVTLESEGAGFKISRSALTLKAAVPGVEKAKFEQIALGAKTGCPVSKLMTAEVTLDLTLE